MKDIFWKIDKVRAGIIADAKVENEVAGQVVDLAFDVIVEGLKIGQRIAAALDQIADNTRPRK